MSSSPLHLVPVALLCAALWIACAGTPDPTIEASVGFASAEAGRARIERYLDDTQPFDHTNTFEASEVARLGAPLVEPLQAMLEEESRPRDTYHLIRLACAMIRDGHASADESVALRGAVDVAYERLRADSREARWSAIELLRCDPPPGETGTEGRPEE